MPMNLSIESIVKRFDTISANRSNWENLWQTCADYCLPQKAIVTQARSPGTQLNTQIYDSTAIQATQTLAAGLHSYMTNPTSRWFSLATRDKKLMDSFNVKSWLKESEDTIFSYLNSSNFNQSIHESYIDFGVFGTSCLYEEEDPVDIIRFHARPMSEIYILANERGRIDTVYRKFTYTARQAYQMWGANSGQKVFDLLEANKVEEKVTFLHVVLPREERNVKKKDAKNMPFASLYIEPKSKKVLSEGGYEEFPFFVPRFYKVSDSEYAYAPASISIADIKMLNAMSKTTIKAAQKNLNPPIILPHDGYLLPFKTTAGGINYKLHTAGATDEKVEILDIKRDIGIGLEMENQRRQSIQKAFFVDLFLMLANLPDRTTRTATEIVERVNELMLILGPVLGRLMHEKLDPIVTRTFNILLRNGKIPPPPEALIGKDYKIEYISPLAKAQRASESKSIVELLAAVREMQAMNPSVVDNINYDKTTREFGDIFNTSADILNSDDEIKAIREQRAEQEKIQQALEQGKLGSEALKNTAEAGAVAGGGD